MVGLVFGLAAAFGPAAQAIDSPPAECVSHRLESDVRLTTYVLTGGDRLSLLARRFNLPNEDLTRWNPWVSPASMKVGDVVVLPLRDSHRLSRDELCKPIERGLRGRSRIALTFDAGADVGALDELLAVLRDRHAKCSFFVTGLWIKRNPDALRRIAAGGHEILNHSYSHPLLPTLSSEGIAEELEKTDRLIARVTGRRPPRYFRPPFGAMNRHVLEAAGEAGWQCVYWTLDSCDAVGTVKSPRYVAGRVLHPPHGHEPRHFLDGAIVLFHLAKPGTARAMWHILDGLADLRLEPVTLTKLLEPGTPPPRPVSDAALQTAQ